jgi:hypothetical protein
MTLRVGTKRYMVVEYLKTLDKNHNFNDAINEIHKIVGTTLNEARTYYRTLGSEEFIPNFHSNYIAGKRGRKVGEPLKVHSPKSPKPKISTSDDNYDLNEIRKRNLKRIKDVHQKMNYGMTSTLTNYRYDDIINNNVRDLIRQDGMVETILFDE